MKSVTLFVMSASNPVEINAESRLSFGVETLKVIGGILLILCWLLVFVGQWLYFAMLESGKSQATVGKRVLGLQVTDRQGVRVSFGRATGRFFAKLISALPFDIGFMMAGWTQRKQALHDMIADTLVVRKPGA